MTSPSKFPKRSVIPWNVSAAFSLLVRDLKKTWTHMMSSKAEQICNMCSGRAESLLQNQKVHRAMYRKSVQRCICPDFSHTVRCAPAQVDLKRQRYTCSVLAPDRVGRECLYKSSVTNSCFFLHHIKGSILPKSRARLSHVRSSFQKEILYDNMESSASASFLATLYLYQVSLALRSNPKELRIRTCRSLWVIALATYIQVSYVDV